MTAIGICWSAAPVRGEAGYRGDQNAFGSPASDRVLLAVCFDFIFPSTVTLLPPEVFHIS